MILQDVFNIAGRFLRIFNIIRTALIAFAAAAVVSCGFITTKVISGTLVSYHKRVNRGKIENKRAEVEKRRLRLRQKLEVDGVLVSQERSRIISLDIHEVVRLVHNGELDCVQVLHAYQAKALEVTEELNCVTEFIDEAEEWAIALDHSAEKLPLHGIPFSVKDVFNVAGYDTTLGIAKNLDNPAAEDSSLIKALKGLGAIPFCKTNIPQLAMSFGSSNPVWGVTKNPFNHERAPGGSSSGEGALIGSGASLFGVGSDIAGSLRSPAVFCGIATLKATPPRFVDSLRSEGVVGLTALPGIMARDVETLTFIHKILWEDAFTAKREPRAVPLLWQEKLLHVERKLRVGFYEETEMIPTTPGVKRAIRMCHKLFQKNGHEMIPFRPPDMEEVSLSCLSIFHADELEIFDNLLQYEDVDPTISVHHFYGRRAPFFLRPIIAPIIGIYSPTLQEFFKVVGGRTSHSSKQLSRVMVKKTHYKKQLMKQWKENNLDLCIGPVFLSPAPKLKDMDLFFGIFEAYTVMYNYVDFPAGVVPVTKENESDQQLLRDYPTHDSRLQLIKESTAGATGMPIGVQVVGLPFRDELVLHGMQLIESYLKQNDD